MNDRVAYFDMLSEGECLELLGRHNFGRLAIEIDGQPDIFPVNYVLDDDRVVFRTAAGTKLDHASLNKVAFEVDEFDGDRRSASSVVVKGTAREFTEAIDERSLHERELASPTWMPSSDMHWVRIVPREITGRQVWSS